MTSDATARPQVVLIFGASSGIGRAVAHEVSRRGDHVVLLARSQPALDETAGECQELGASSVTVRSVDIADRDAVNAAITTSWPARPGVDVVVQAAGVAAYGSFDELPADVFDGVLRTNVMGSANVARAVLPRMRGADHGAFYLVGSVVGTIGVPGMSAYTVSKWGVRALARALQLENRDRSGVSVTLVTPGGVDTPIYLQAANFSGRVGKPPPPVYSPETVARAIVKSFDSPPRLLNVGIANGVMSLGFAVAPRLYDALAGFLVERLTKERTETEPTSGNVLVPVPAGNELHGRHPGVLGRLRPASRG